MRFDDMTADYMRVDTDLYGNEMCPTESIDKKVPLVKCGLIHNRMKKGFWNQDKILVSKKKFDVTKMEKLTLAAGTQIGVVGGLMCKESNARSPRKFVYYPVSDPKLPAISTQTTICS